MQWYKREPSIKIVCLIFEHQNILKRKKNNNMKLNKKASIKDKRNIVKITKGERDLRRR